MPTAPRRPRPWSSGRFGASALGSFVVTYLSVIVLLPVVALVGHAFGNGWSGFFSSLTTTEARDALALTLATSAVATVVNVLFGTALAWVLARDSFPGLGLVNAVIDLPFALPTVVAGVTLMTLYGPHSPLHLSIANTPVGIIVALLFVTLPFTVRSVQPLVATLQRDDELAAQTLGASRWRAWRTVVLPSLLPGIATGAGLAFARAVGEFGSVVFISGNRPFHTEVASSYVFMLSQDQAFNSAAAVSVFLLVVALVVLAVAHATSRRLATKRHG